MPIWKFAIDVGGTFTDCVATDLQGSTVGLKVLSSAACKFSLAENSNRQTVRLNGGPSFPFPLSDQFWRGYGVHFLKKNGKVHQRSAVADFDADSNEITLRDPLSQALGPGSVVELRSPELSPIFVIRCCLGLRLDQRLPPVELRLGTTLATNALLTRSGAATALLVTKGFRDLLEIGYQNRPALFDLTINKRELLTVGSFEIDERLAADGLVLRALDAPTTRRQLEELRRQSIDSLAVCLLHSYKNPEHELLVGQLAAEAGFSHVYLSHQVSPTLGLLDRAETAVADAYLSPVLDEFLNSVEQRLHFDGRLRLMTSAGGLVSRDEFHGKDGILSGPAGGVVGLANAAEAAGRGRVIGFDMGGTSTDVSRYDHGFDTIYQLEKNGLRLNLPAMAIETVAAGGGSICQFDGLKLTVGPDSAGAHPGPACYGHGGPLTVTDMNLFLGRVAIEHFPFRLHRQPVEEQLEIVRSNIRERLKQDLTCEQLALGFVKLANVRMAEAVRSISIRQGTDLRNYTLAAFGGAAAQHACELAELLEMDSILVPGDGGILSAKGIAAARVSRTVTTPVYSQLDDDVLDAARRTAHEVGKKLAQLVAKQEQCDVESLVFETKVELRYTGQNSAIVLPLQTSDSLATDFCSAHIQRFGYADQEHSIEVVTLRTEVTSTDSVDPATESHGNHHSTDKQPPNQTATPPSSPVRFDLGTANTTYSMSDIDADAPVIGPCLVASSYSCVFVAEGWDVRRENGDSFLLTRHGKKQAEAAATTSADPVLLEVFNCRFSSIAAQMGTTLQRTARSVNVKERLDFSCALFTSNGELVANAPHVPVHLGAIGETVRAIAEDFSRMQPGDTFVTNDPFRGGSHLPDVTVVSPVFVRGRLEFFVANRAHHAEIGGVKPGSMWAHSTTLDEEGVLIPSMNLADGGEVKLSRLRALLRDAPFPSRSIEANLADVKAQVAANQQGITAIKALVDECDLDTVRRYMSHIQLAASQQMRLALSCIEDGTYRFSDAMDDGTPIQVAISIVADEMKFDFAGSGPTHPGNLNANLAIVKAAVTYCCRCLIAANIPLNEGILAPVLLEVPTGLLNPDVNSDPRPAVVGGNVETSQRVVDVILGALGTAAASQGTMNNLLFGDESFGYYETICGGAGATSQGRGADAVQTHMTNTRLTDAEILEFRFPVRLHHFGIRPGSGGAGFHRGGHGVERHIEFLKPLEVSLLSQRRSTQPYGLAGGKPGHAGINQLKRVGEGRTDLPGIASFEAQPGDVLTIKTPGGGGWGKGDSQ